MRFKETTSCFTTEDISSKDMILHGATRFDTERYIILQSMIFVPAIRCFAARFPIGPKKTNSLSVILEGKSIMIRNKVFLIMCLISISHTLVFAVNETPVLIWKNTLGETGTNYGFAILKDKNSGFALAGYYSSNGYFPFSINFYRVTVNGIKIFNRQFGASNSMRALDIAQNNANEYYIAGPSGQMSVFKLSNSGDSLWHVTLDTKNGTGDGYAVQALDNGCVFTGNGSAGSPNYSIARVAKISDQGGILWDSSFNTGINHPCTSQSIVVASSGGFLIGGDYFNQDTNHRDAFIIRIDNNGSLVWKKLYGSTADESIYGIVEADNGSFVFCSKLVLNNTDYRIWLVKINAQGDTLWSKSLRDSTMNLHPRRFIRTQDKGYLIIGDCGGTGDWGNNILAIKTDSLGNKQWQYVYTSEIATSNCAYGVVEGDSGEFVFTGYTTINGNFTAAKMLIGKIGLRSPPIFIHPTDTIHLFARISDPPYKDTILAIGKDVGDSILYSFENNTITGLIVDSLSGIITLNPTVKNIGVFELYAVVKNRFGLMSKLPAHVVIEDENHSIISSRKPFSDTSIYEGDNIVFEISTGGASSLVTYNWELNNVPIGNNYLYTLLTDQTSAGKDSLKALLTCEGRNYSTAWAITILNKFLPPSIISPLYLSNITKESGLYWHPFMDPDVKEKPLYQIQVSYSQSFDSLLVAIDSVSDTCVHFSDISSFQHWRHNIPIYWRLLVFGKGFMTNFTKPGYVFLAFGSAIKSQIISNSILKNNFHVIAHSNGSVTMEITIAGEATKPLRKKISITLYSLTGKFISSLYEDYLSSGIYSLQLNQYQLKGISVASPLICRINFDGCNAFKLVNFIK